jgi:alanyl-tRNA synthetase
MIMYSDGRVEIRHEDQNWQNQDTTIRTVTNYTRTLNYVIRDGIVYSPNGTALFK